MASLLQTVSSGATGVIRRAAAERVEQRPLLQRDDMPWLALALVVAVGLRVAWVAYVNIDPTGRGGDPVHYHTMAHLLAEGEGYVNFVSRAPTAHWPPAYPAALAVLYKLFGWHVELAKAFNIACAAATAGIAYIIGARLFDRRVGFAGALLLAVFPGQLYFSTLVLSETMFVAVFMLVLLLALVWTVERADAAWWQLLSIGCLIGVAALVRSEGVFLIFVLAALWALTVRPWPRAARFAAIAAVGVALALTPWTVRNAVQLDEFIPLRANASNVVRRSLDPEAVAPGIRPDPDAPSSSESLRQQLSHPWRVPDLVARRIARFYANDSDGIRWIQRPDAEGSYPFTNDEVRRWRWIADWFFFAAGAAALVAAAACVVCRHRGSLVLVLAAAGWTLLFGAITPTSRFHLALGPVIAIFAALFVAMAWDGGRALLAGRQRPGA